MSFYDRFSQKFTLHPYQVENNNKLRLAINSLNCKSVMLQQPTGTGKSVQIAEIVCKAVDNGLRPLIIVPSRDLIQNLTRYLGSFGLTPGIFQGNTKTNYAAHYFIGTASTLVNRIGQVPLKPDFLIIDEAHHLKADGWLKVFKFFSQKGIKAIHFTATPERLDGRGFEDVCDHLITSNNIRWFIDNGYLSDFDYYLPEKTFKAFNISGGDDKLGLQAEYWDTPTITGDAIDQWKENALGQQTIVFCCTTEHADHVAEAYNDFGKEYYGKPIAAKLDYKTPKDEYTRIIKAFERGDLKIITNVNLLSEGVDFPSVSCCQFLRLTASVSRYLQMIGRVLRKDKNNPTKRSVILDQVNMIKNHGLPDRSFNWSLKGGVQDEVSQKYLLTCPNCEETLSDDYRKLKALSQSSFTICPSCQSIVSIPGGTRETRSPRSESLEVESGKLAKMNLSARQLQITSIVAEQRKKDYKKFWAVSKAMKIPDLQFVDIKYLCSLLGYQVNYALRLWKPYKAIYYPILERGFFNGSQKEFAELTGLTVGEFQFNFFWDLLQDHRKHNVSVDESVNIIDFAKGNLFPF